MTKWKPFNFKENYKELNKNVSVKLINGKEISIWNMVGGKPLDITGENINIDDIGWFAPKKDWNRFNELQKHFNNMSFLYGDEDIIDNIEWAIKDSLNIKFDENHEFSKAIETLRRYIDKAQESIIEESRGYL